MITKEFIKDMPLSDIFPYYNNPRDNEAAAVEVAESMKQTGNLDPIEIDENHIILSGHTRYKALKLLNKDKTDVVVVSGLSKKQKTKYRLLANKTGEAASWDIPKLNIELQGLNFDGFDFGFNDVDIDGDIAPSELDALMPEIPKTEKTEKPKNNGEDFFSRSATDGNAEYNDFVAKFELPKTTDDCYTPPAVYDCVADFVIKEYHVKKADIVRPFYPGGDYQNFDYTENSVVVDNPPFSILSEIVKFYQDNGIKFFIFAPGLTTFNALNTDKVTAIAMNCHITYENGALVSTSFITNLDKKYRVRTCPQFRYDLMMAQKKDPKPLISYKYPDEVITSAEMGTLSLWDVDFNVPFAESRFLTNMDELRKAGKKIFGSGIILSEKMAKEHAQAKKEMKEKTEKPIAKNADREIISNVWRLSDREMEIVKELGNGNKGAGG